MRCLRKSGQRERNKKNKAMVLVPPPHGPHAWTNGAMVKYGVSSCPSFASLFHMSFFFRVFPSFLITFHSLHIPFHCSYFFTSLYSLSALLSFAPPPFRLIVISLSSHSIPILAPLTTHAILHPPTDWLTRSFPLGNPLFARSLSVSLSHTHLHPLFLSLARLSFVCFVVSCIAHII